MANLPTSGVNGGPNGVHYHSSSGTRPDTSRPITFRDALPYSPQASTLPFIPDLIPNPVLGSGSPALSTLDILPVNELDHINQEASAEGSLTKHGKQAMEAVFHELKPVQRTQYKFQSIATNRSPRPKGKSLANDLSPCAKVLYDKVGGYFKVSKANNGAPITNGPAKAARPSNEPSTPILPSGATNEQAHGSNSARIEVAIPVKSDFDKSQYMDTQAFLPPAPATNGTIIPEQQQYQTYQQPPLVQSHGDGRSSFDQTAHYNQSGFRIEIPSAQFNRDEYQEVPEQPGEPHNLSRMKERQDIGITQSVLGDGLDQRQLAESALKDLRRRNKAIIEATRAAFNMETGHGHLVVLTSEQEPALTGDEQKKIYAAIQKVISLNIFQHVPVEDLSQLLRLSEASIKDALSLELQIDQDWDEASITSWIQQLSGVDTALKAARTSARILTGGREDRQLYSESLIDHSIKIFQKVVDEIIIPVVGWKNSGSSGAVFKTLSKFKKDISAIFISCQKLLAMLAELISKVQLTDLALNSLEFVSSNLIFVENAHYEKDSIVGLQKFDGIRSAAMDSLCQIFLAKPEQRQGIVNEILSSLSKLPINRQSSRQFKLSDGGSIQPVSALVMRLVQASAASADKESQGRRDNLIQAIHGGDEGGDIDELQGPSRKIGSASINSESQGADQPDVACQDLATVAYPLGEEAQRNASLVINFLVQRAAGSTKSGDTPYRNLLDLFVDDFTVCLDSPDWPSAELLLRCLMSSMIYLFENEKTAAPTKNMALEVLGNLSAAISRLRSHIKKMANTNEGSDTNELSNFLSDLALQTLDRQSRPEQLLAWTGPYRVTVESVQPRNRHDAHLAGAVSFLLTTWAQRLTSLFENITDEDESRDREIGRMTYRLRMMIEDRTWLTSQFEFKSVSAHQTKLSYAILVISSPLCESFERMLSILLSSMSSDQATVRSRSLKSVSHVLETDPSLLEGDSTVVDRIVECSTDPSTQVRESALSLIGNCMSLKPGLETALSQPVLNRFSDLGVSVRRRAMRLARDIYLRNHDKALRSQIAGAILRRIITDTDESVRDAARQMVEEVWFVPFYGIDESATSQTSLAEHTTLIIRTFKAGGLQHNLDKIFKSILNPENKLASGPFSVCSKLVANMFGFINNPASDDPNVPSSADALAVLTMFAKAEPKLFTFEQIRLIKPQLASANVKIPEELEAFSSMVTILGAVLPQLSSVHLDFITELRALLMPKVAATDVYQALDELFRCMRVIANLTGDTRQNFSLARSALVAVHKFAQPGAMDDPKARKQFRAYAGIIHLTAKHFDLDSYVDTLKTLFKDFKGDSFARLVVEKLAPFSGTDQEAEVRQSAIKGIAIVCQAWPRNYTIPRVWSLFQQVFIEREPALEQIVLNSFKEFLFTEERRSEASTKAGDKTAGKEKEKKSLTVMGGTSYDDVASATTQRFLKDITRISLATQDHYAETALEVLASINRQGLTHPKETGVTLITLETSENKFLADLAFQEHKALHEKHESTIEREYSKAVQSAYEYQRDVVGDTRGLRGDPPQSKLHNMIDVLKISKMKNRQRFFEKLCSLIDFDPGTVDAEPDMPPHLDLTRFIVENMAFFEYQTIGELQTAVRKLEDIVAGAGAATAQAIDSEIFNVRMDVNLDAQIQQQLNDTEPHGQVPELPISVQPARLRQLATSSIILLLIWETRTYLRRLYGMGTSRHDSKAKALAKDLNRNPTKAQNVHPDKILEELANLPNSLQSQETMVQRCKMLVELMSIDSEFKVADEDEDMELEDPSTPSDGEAAEDGDPRGRKRKMNTTPGGRKKRPRSSSQPRKRGRPRKNPEESATGVDAEGDWI